MFARSMMLYKITTLDYFYILKYHFMFRDAHSPKLGDTNMGTVLVLSPYIAPGMWWCYTEVRAPANSIHRAAHQVLVVNYQ